MLVVSAVTQLEWFKGKGESIEMCPVDTKHTVSDMKLDNATSFLSSAIVKRTLR
jgi:hypothetical protein